MEIKKLSVLEKELNAGFKKAPSAMGRYIRYSLFMACVLGFYWFAHAVGNGHVYTEGDIMVLEAFIIFPFTFLFFGELYHFYLKKKYGLSYWKTFDESVKDLLINGKLIDDTVDDGNDKKDLDYWFGLFEKGAISEDEYEVKKRELL